MVAHDSLICSCVLEACFVVFKPRPLCLGTIINLFCEPPRTTTWARGQISNLIHSSPWSRCLWVRHHSHSFYLLSWSPSDTAYRCIRRCDIRDRLSPRCPPQYQSARRLRQPRRCTPASPHSRDLNSAFYSNHYTPFLELTLDGTIPILQQGGYPLRPFVFVLASCSWSHWVP